MSTANHGDTGTELGLSARKRRNKPIHGTETIRVKTRVADFIYAIVEHLELDGTAELMDRLLPTELLETEFNKSKEISIRNLENKLRQLQEDKSVPSHKKRQRKGRPRKKR